MSHPSPFKWRHFESEIILLCVRWYLRYALSYRDLEEMIAERGLSVDHTTIFRWVQHYAPELDKRSRPHLKACNDSWRVDETSIKGATRTWPLTLSEAKESSSLVGFRFFPKSLMATGVASG
jgi:transposase-like protein